MPRAGPSGICPVVDAVLAASVWSGLMLVGRRLGQFVTALGAVSENGRLLQEEGHLRGDRRRAYVAFFQVTSSRCRRGRGCGAVVHGEGIAELLSAAHEIGDDSALVAAFVVVLAAVDVVGAEAEHAVDQAGELVGGGGNGFGRAETSLQAAMEGPERGVAVVEGAGGEAERGSRAARGGFGAAAALLAAGEVAAGGEAEPGGEVFFRGPPGHVEADLADHGEGGGVDAIDPGEVDPGEAMQVLAGVE